MFQFFQDWKHLVSKSDFFDALKPCFLQGLFRALSTGQFTDDVGQPGEVDTKIGVEHAQSG
jgi:hypothetical protein